MNSNWLDLLFLTIGGIAAMTIAYCVWESLHTWHARRDKPASPPPHRR